MLSTRQPRAVREEVIEVEAAIIVVSVSTGEFKKGLHFDTILTVPSMCTIYRVLVNLD